MVDIVTIIPSEQLHVNMLTLAFSSVQPHRAAGMAQVKVQSLFLLSEIIADKTIRMSHDLHWLHW